uniref:Uncharacterized protein n=1 Tax=Rhizophora mucronata TaxID=61149 RepID=A0A2P2QJ43_RHIMU
MQNPFINKIQFGWQYKSVQSPRSRDTTEEGMRESMIEKSSESLIYNETNLKPPFGCRKLEKKKNKLK